MITPTREVSNNTQIMTIGQEITTEVEATTKTDLNLKVIRGAIEEMIPVDIEEMIPVAIEEVVPLEVATEAVIPLEAATEAVIPVAIEEVIPLGVVIHIEVMIPLEGVIPTEVATEEAVAITKMNLTNTAGKMINPRTLTIWKVWNSSLRRSLSILS